MCLGFHRFWDLNLISHAYAASALLNETSLSWHTCHCFIDSFQWGFQGMCVPWPKQWSLCLWGFTQTSRFQIRLRFRLALPYLLFSPLTITFRNSRFHFPVLLCGHWSVISKACYQRSHILPFPALLSMARQMSWQPLKQHPRPRWKKATCRGEREAQDRRNLGSWPARLSLASGSLALCRRYMRGNQTCLFKALAVWFSSNTTDQPGCCVQAESENGVFLFISYCVILIQTMDFPQICRVGWMAWP